jgi:hypothetical protein
MDEPSTGRTISGTKVYQVTDEVSSENNPSGFRAARRAMIQVITSDLADLYQAKALALDWRSVSSSTSHRSCEEQLNGLVP